MIKAKKKFGQNFLKDSVILDKIIQAIPKSCDNIIEIGPGLGDLTARLVEISAVESYEIDEELFEILGDKFQNEILNGRLKIHLGDVLERDSLSSKSYFLVANLPYYIATNIILKALDDELCDGFIVMVQREVGVKFCAKSGDREFGALSVLAGLSGECEMLFSVLPQSFDPPPKVTSAVIRLIKTTTFNDEKFKEFLKVAFLAPRKTLFKNLSAKFDRNLVTEIFNKLEISSNLRPHQSNNALFLEIYKNLKAENGKQQSKLSKQR